MRRLPPLTAVEAFVQVARLGSVKAAAEELALSSPALSRRVQALERFVGQSLFERRHQAMMLNAQGEQLLSRLSPALDALAAAIDPQGDDRALRLRLGVPALFASQQLIGRLPELRLACPQLHIDIDTAPYALARLGDGLDAAIVLAREVDPALCAFRLGRNKMYMIGARALAEGPDALTDPRQIAGVTMLLHRDMGDTLDLWRDAAGIPDVAPAAIDYFDSGQLMLDAAARGLGIALMLDSHLADAHDDRIVRLFGVDVESELVYWFACRRTALARRPVKLFHDWLLATMPPA